ncbi:UNVERIFIED_CONTAM: hypothetical protein HDU68_000436 [Siphonaria sp. JEL0065]|nr:hypothetical protein HDU68_000436 [Siphonaria sp. JEL0065]
MELTNNQFEESDVIEELERIAVLVRGVWVLRSELMYSGRTADARRLLLQLLGRSSKPVSRFDINRIAKLPHSVVTNMFMEICARVAIVTEAHSGHHVGGGKVLPGTENVSKWGLKVEGDDEFCERYGDVVKRQREVVEAEGERARHALENKVSTRGTPQRGHAATPVGIPLRGPAKTECESKTAAVALSSSSTAAASAPTATASGSRSNQNAAPRAPASAVDNFTVTGATPEAQCENLIYFALNKHGVCSYEYLTAVLNRHKGLRTTDGSDNFLDGEDVTPELIKEVMDRLCTFVQGRYILKRLGSSVDEFRDPVVELFHNKTSLKKGEITAACQTATGKNITQSTYAKIMKELATSSGPSWELKTGPSA